MSTIANEKISFEVKFVQYMFNATFNKCSVISWRSVLLVKGKKTEYPEKTTHLSQVIDKLYHITLHHVNIAMNWVRTHNFSSDGH